MPLFKEEIEALLMLVTKELRHGDQHDLMASMALEHLRSKLTRLRDEVHPAADMARAKMGQVIEIPRKK